MRTSTLLIIDDAPDVHALVRARLADDGYDIRSAYDAEAGAVLARTLKPDVILLDIDLPGEDGFSACMHLKEDPQTRRIPVIFLTASRELASKVQGLELGAVDFVTKPFEPDELRARVRASLRTKSLIDDLAQARVNWFVREAVAPLARRAG